MLKAWLWLSLVFALACETGEEPNADAGVYDGRGLTCLPAQAAAPATLAASRATWLLTDDSIVAVGLAPNGHGYQISRFSTSGEPREASWTAFPDAVTPETISIAAVGGVLAIAQQAYNHCELGLLRLSDQTELQAPTAVSDATSNVTPLCEVAAMKSGFVVAWQQFTSRTSDAASLFAQRMGPDGAKQGDRITLLADTISKQAALALASDDTRVAIAFRGATQAASTLAFVTPDSLQTQALPDVTEPFRSIERAHDGFLLRTSTKLYVLDKEGRATAKPYELGLEGLAAPLGDGYVIIEHDEFLVARSIDAALSQTSDALGINDDRSADAAALVSAADGGETFLLFYGEGGLKLLQLGCGSKVEPLGPKACAHDENLQPVDLGCDDPICHAAIRLDYLTLGVRGWSVSGGAAQSVDAASATSAAQKIFSANSEYITNPPEVTGPAAGLYLVYASPVDFGGFALVGEHSGVVVAAGGIVWAGRGGYWEPQTWRAASDIRCGDKLVSPVDQTLDDGSCTGEANRGASAADAMKVALSTNVALALAEQGKIKARAYLYTPSTGSCSPGDAEWLVVLTREQ